MLEGVARMVAAHHEMNRQQGAINQDVTTTLARIETPLARMISHGENGCDASRTRTAAPAVSEEDPPWQARQGSAAG
jgi:hypothetical protein